MDMDVPLIRDLLIQVIDWPKAGAGVRRVASSMWHDLDDANRDAGVVDLDVKMARLTGELRACRYDRDWDIAPVVAALREAVRKVADASSGWEMSAHQRFAARTRAAARAAGLDLTERRG